MVNPVSSGKMAPQGVEPAVLSKLITFAILMAVVPIGTYFGSLKYLWNGSTTYSALSAVLLANVVLIGYVIVAFREDIPPPPSGGIERKKDK
ncbi:vacuolar ATPase assembly integral membrane protein VMA21, partial [Tremellales sp. Uapishka_1]